MTAKAKTKAFDASKYLTDLGGRDYLEVKWRLLWLRTEHPEAVVETELVKHETGLALFRARVTVPGGGTATGWGSETAEDFGDFIEKAETKALGRALAALGYGTQFCEDFDFSSAGRDQRASRSGRPQRTVKVVDAPVARAGDLKVVRDQAREAATSSQIRAIYSIVQGRSPAEGTVEQRCRAAYDCLPGELSKHQASEFIDALRRPAQQAVGSGAAAGHPQPR